MLVKWNFFKSIAGVTNLQAKHIWSLKYKEILTNMMNFVIPE